MTDDEYNTTHLKNTPREKWLKDLAFLDLCICGSLARAWIKPRNEKNIFSLNTMIANANPACGGEHRRWVQVFRALGWIERARLVDKKPKHQINDSCFTYQRTDAPDLDAWLSTESKDYHVATIRKRADAGDARAMSLLAIIEVG